MKIISSTDVIYATVLQRGSMVATLCLSGLASLKELLATLRRKLGDCVGMVTVSLRNSSRGWTDSRSLIWA